ncbi:hypothetical protein [Streptomyces sp. NPDC005907]|uniref:hypothetical protein n=1 Tax=Streptomyces sp. NPDC005907 TaxID=3154571 RepID=UPI0033D455CF
MSISVTHSDGRHESYNDRGTFGTLLQLRRERKQREARAAREARLVELERNIEALEAWHHDWRLRYDDGYRALHPGEWCDHHAVVRKACGHRHVGHRRDLIRGEHGEITTWSGVVIRRGQGYR